jgi:hypothetical protein
MPVPAPSPGRSTIPDELGGFRSGGTPVIPRPPRLPHDSASLPRASLDLGLDFAELAGLSDSFTEGDAVSPTMPCPPSSTAQDSKERPTVPSPSSKTSGVRRIR